MALEYNERGGAGPTTSCVACPFCDEELNERQSLAKHLRGACEEV